MPDFPPRQPIQVYATPWCGDTRRARRVLDETGIPYEFIDIRHDSEAADWVEQVNNGYRSSPTIRFPDGDILVEPSAAQLRAKLEALWASGVMPVDDSDRGRHGTDTV